MKRKIHSLWPFALLLWLLSPGNALAATEYPDVWLRELPDMGDSHSLGFFQLGDESEINPFDNKDEVVLLRKKSFTGEFGGRVNAKVVMVGFFTGKTVTGKLVKKSKVSNTSGNLRTNSYAYYVVTDSGKYLSLKRQYYFIFRKDLNPKHYKQDLDKVYYIDSKIKLFFKERNTRYQTCEVVTEYQIWDDFYAGNSWQKYVLVKSERPVYPDCPYLGNEPLSNYPPLTSYIDSESIPYIYRLDDGTALLPLQANIVRIRLDGTVPEAYQDRIAMVDAERMHAFKQQLLEKMREDGRLRDYAAFQIINDEIEKEFFPIRAGFDCAKASTEVEKRICGDVLLSNLDADLSRRYKKARERTKDIDALKQSQREWLAKRNGCGSQICLEKSYHARLAELDELLKATTE